MIVPTLEAGFEGFEDGKIERAGELLFEEVTTRRRVNQLNLVSQYVTRGSAVSCASSKFS